MAQTPYGTTSFSGGYSLPSLGGGSGTTFGVGDAGSSLGGMAGGMSGGGGGGNAGKALTAIGGAMPMVGALASIGGTIYKGIQAGKQKKQADQLREEYKRPTYEIPESVQQALQISKNLSLSGLPGVDLIEQQIMGQTSAGARAIGDSAQGAAEQLAAITGLYSQGQQNLGALGVQDAQAQLMNQQNLVEQLNQYGQYEDKKFEINKFQPYLQAMQAAAALQEASMRNTEAVIGDATSLFGGLSAYGGQALQGLGAKKAAEEQKKNQGGGSAMSSLTGALGF
jgi:hypothetical protein